MTTAIALFNNKGGVGRTTLTYHLANMVARLGWRVLAGDLDPQANLTSAFFDEDKLGDSTFLPELYYMAVTPGGGPPPPPPPAASVLLGTDTVENNPDSNAGGQAEAFSTVAAASGTVTKLRFYASSETIATSAVVGLYADSGAHPGALLGQSTITAPVSGWNEVSVSGVAVTSGTTYWLAVLSLAGQGTFVFRDRGGGASSPAETSAETNLTALPATWSSGTTFLDGPISAYGAP